jgi:formylmethanofuran dehydrogenase subunit B
MPMDDALPRQPRSRGGSAETVPFGIDGAFACTACPMLCEINPAPIAAQDAVARLVGCGHASQWIPRAVRRHASAADAGPMIAGRPASLEEAVASAVARLLAARRVLMTGVSGLSLEGIRAAAALAERLVCGFDTGSAEASSPAGPTLARVGGVTADWEELRDRADLVLLHAIDPSATHPRFLERFLTPAVHGRPRRVVVIGPESVPLDGVELLRVPVPEERSVDAARLLEAALRGIVAWQDLCRQTPGTDAGPTAGTAAESGGGAMRLSLRPEDGRTLGAWFAEARCIGVVHRVAALPEANGAGGVAKGRAPSALEWFAVAGLVRALAHRGPAFAIPLGAGTAAGGPNGAAAAAVATWRYGAAGGIARAVASGGRFLPGECDGRTLAARGEVDLILVAGVAPAWLDRIPEAASACGLVVVGPPESGRRGPAPCVAIPTAWPGFDETGSLLREDGRGLRASGWFASGLPSAAVVLRAIEETLAAHRQEGADPIGPLVKA